MNQIYIIVSGDDQISLATAVNEAIAMSYMPHGTPFIGKDGNTYNQAMMFSLYEPPRCSVNAWAHDKV